MNDRQTKWGVVATVKASVREVLEFSAHHLDIGADQIIIYLDDANKDSFDALNKNPKIKPILCNHAYWKSTKGWRPKFQEVRQSTNATHAYQNIEGLNWLTHIDVDEFIVSDKEISQTLGELPQNCKTARVFPVESMSDDATCVTSETFFKACHRNADIRRKETQQIYPEFGKYLGGGFLSHTIGKMFFRTGINQLDVRIHNVFVDGKSNPDVVQLDCAELYHVHARNWQDWYKRFPKRHELGAYKPDRVSNIPVEDGGVPIHQILEQILSEHGVDGLKRFYHETCVATPELRERLEKYGHLRSYRFNLSEKVSRHFPIFDV